jgi:hypothetical protein
MLFSKAGVCKVAQDGDSFIVELGYEAEDSLKPFHVSNPLAIDEVRNLLRHMELNEAEIEQQLRYATKPKTSAASA